MGSLKKLPTHDRLASVVISNLSPRIEGGRYPAKRVESEPITVGADIFKDGHDIVVAVAKWRKQEEKTWNEVPMSAHENDQWSTSLTFSSIGHYEIVVTAWADDFLTWLHDYERRLTGDQDNFSTEIEEGRVILNNAAIRAAGGKSHDDAEAIEDLTTELMKSEGNAVPALMNDPKVLALLARWPDRNLASTSEELIQLIVETKQSAYSAWYEFFPRCAEGIKDRHSTFRDCLPRIEDAKAMGFDVIYFPPIHPIGESHRKGKNNTVTCEPDDVGSPWAIGNKNGGHRSVEPALGTIDDFVWLLGEAKKMDMVIAIDFAINCSPDHPYVEEHPEWFYHRPDGSIKYAEKPPKKYKDN
ncbi:MAG: DUF3416 domain-containing protein [Verrucomicrobiales bacterium]|nr:DUF3416 domain-containing protein [Verrucomicrobiales bacterium]